MNIENEDGAGANENSLRDDLAAALAEATARETDGSLDAGGESTGSEPQTSAENGDHQAGQSTAAERADGRDANGRFAAKSKAPEAAGGDADGGVAQAAPQAESQADGPPASWRENEKAEWNSLSPAARAAITRREKEVGSLVGRQDGERAFGREMADVLRPYGQTFQQFGVSPQTAISVLLKNDAIMRGNDVQAKVQLAYSMLQDYGLNPAAFAQGLPGQSNDPAVQALQREIQALQTRLTQQGQQGQQFAPLPASNEENTIAGDIEAFRSDPAHPHFDQVHQQMAGLIESGAAPDLESAYLMAVAGNPSLRSTPPAMQAQAQRPSQVAAARRAASSVVASPGAPGSQRPASLRDELREQLRSVGFS